MTATAVAVGFIRHRGEVLLLLGGGEAGPYSDRWGTVIGDVETDPERTARRAIREQTGMVPEEIRLVRTGESFSTGETAFADQLVVYPFLFDSERRAVETNRATRRYEWVRPTALLRRETVPGLWRAYDRVRPTVATITTDTEHGSTWLSTCALEVLRDEAGLVASNRASEFDDTAAVARVLVDARPAMTAVANRVHRALSDAGPDPTPRGVETAAHDSIERALDADRQTAEATASEMTGKRVATLSRSGTVLDALEMGTPETVLVAESRPGREGVDVAEALASTTDVTLTTDAGFASQLRARDVDVLVVGADTVLPDGRVLNKVGTRSAAIVATHEGIPVLVATASDKIRPDCRGESDQWPHSTVDLEPRDGAELYDGDADISLVTHTFDVTPTDCIDAVVTERGRLDTEEIRAVATEHARLAPGDYWM